MSDEPGPISEKEIQFFAFGLSARDMVSMFDRLREPTARATEALAGLSAVLRESGYDEDQVIRKEARRLLSREHMRRRAGLRKFRRPGPLCIDGHAYRRRCKRRVKRRA